MVSPQQLKKITMSLGKRQSSHLCFSHYSTKVSINPQLGEFIEVNYGRKTALFSWELEALWATLKYLINSKLSGYFLYYFNLTGRID
ncbi:MAG: hypothetical protein AAFY76_15490 [Cyanobacteria bacterium J06649_11]